MRPLASPFRTKVVGVTFVDGYPDNLFTLERLVVRRDLYDEDHVMADLRRDPDNDADPNAIVVDVPKEGVGVVGHVPAPIAARLAPELDSGEPWEAEVVKINVGVDNADNPGVTLEIRRVTPA